MKLGVTLGASRGAGSGGGSARAYLFRDLFTTDAAAPLASPRTCEGGPGTLTVTGTTQTIASGKYTFLSAAIAWGLNAPTGFDIARAAGRVLVYSGLNFTSLTTSLDFGFRSTVGLGATLVQGFRLGSGGSAFLLGNINAGQTPTLTDILSFGEYDFAIVLRSTGCFLFYRAAGATPWTLLYIDDLTTTATLYQQFKHQSVAGTLDAILVPPELWLPTPLVSQASGAYGPTALSTADIQASLVCGGTADQSIIFRRQDANNYWRMRRLAATCILQEVVAGSGTTRATTSKTAAAGDRIQFRAEGATIRCWHQSPAGTITTMTAYASASNFQTETTVAIEDGANAGQFDVYGLSHTGIPT